MKKLQNNFTTPEQSKRLLELGLPAETADCVLENLDTAENDFASKYYTRWIIEERHMNADIFTENYKNIFLPCWSVGRLIEIMLNSQIDTGTYALGFMLDKDTFSIESLIDIIDEDIKEFDFSKLEE